MKVCFEDIFACEDMLLSRNLQSLDAGFRARIQNQDSLQTQLERERGENSELKARISRLESDMSCQNSSEQEMSEMNCKLRSAVEMLKEELRLTRDQLTRAQDSNDKVLAQQRASWLDEKSQLDSRVHELIEQKGALNNKLTKVTAVHKKVLQSIVLSL